MNKDYRDEIKFLSRPGATKSRSGAISAKISCGLSLSDKMGLNGYSSVGFTHSRVSDTDDEGIVGSEKRNKISTGLGVEFNASLASEIGLRAGAGLSAYRQKSRGVNYASASDAVREKLAHKSFTYKRLRLIDTIFTKKHSLVHHQARAQNSQDLLKNSWEGITKKTVKSDSPSPFQAIVKTKQVESTVFTAQLDANVQLASFANAGAKLISEYGKHDIGVDFHTDMFKGVTEGIDIQLRRNNLDQVAAFFQQAFATITDDSAFVDQQKLCADLSLDGIHSAVTALDKRISDYSAAVRLHCLGDSAATKAKHMMEKEWDISALGRYGFLQCAEVMLATLASRLPADVADNGDAAELKALMTEVNKKIVSPAFSYNNKKLMPMVSFNNLLSIIKTYRSVTAEINASIGRNGASGGGKIGISLVETKVKNPYRIRAGKQRDVEITLTGNVTLSNLLDQLTEGFANKVGISLESLRNSVTSAFNGSFDLSAGAKIIVRYFSPDWAKMENGKRRYTHQVTYLQTLKAAKLSGALPVSAVSAVGLDLGISGESNKTDVALQLMGSDTLNYLMLRYNYLGGRTEEASVWQDVIEENRSNLVKLMKNIVTQGTNSADELEFIRQEKLKGLTDATLIDAFNKQFASVKQNITAVQADDSKFDSAMKALITLMLWHKEKTDSIFTASLKPQEFILPKKKVFPHLGF